MTLEEAIKHCEEVAERKERDAEEIAMHDAEGVYQPQVGRCSYCAEEHRQLAEWLRELQIYRQKLTEIEAAVNFYKSCETCQGFREYPTDEFVKDLLRVLEVPADADSD